MSRVHLVGVARAAHRSDLQAQVVGHLKGKGAHPTGGSIDEQAVTRPGLRDGKALWLGAVALPLWLDDNLTGATREQTIKVLWVIFVIAVIPWRHAFRQFVLANGERWR